MVGNTVCVDPLAPLRTVGERLASPAEGLAQAIAERVISLVVDALDVNAVLDKVDLERLLDRIDVNSLVDRVDVNHLLATVDVNRLLSTVDLNAVLDRVDMNAIVGRVDVEALVEQTDLGAIIAKSSSGMASDVVDAMRSRAVGVDESLARLVARLRRRPYTGPPGPPAALRAGAAA